MNLSDDTATGVKAKVISFLFYFIVLASFFAFLFNFCQAYTKVTGRNATLGHKKTQFQLNFYSVNSQQKSSDDTYRTYRVDLRKTLNTD